MARGLNEWTQRLARSVPVILEVAFDVIFVSLLKLVYLFLISTGFFCFVSFVGYRFGFATWTTFIGTNLGFMPNFICRSLAFQESFKLSIFPINDILVALLHISGFLFPVILAPAVVVAGIVTGAILIAITVTPARRLNMRQIIRTPDGAPTAKTTGVGSLTVTTRSGRVITTAGRVVVTTRSLVVVAATIRVVSPTSVIRSEKIYTRRCGTDSSWRIISSRRHIGACGEESQAKDACSESE
jgi:hypothetical protein